LICLKYYVVFETIQATAFFAFCRLKEWKNYRGLKFCFRSTKDIGLMDLIKSGRAILKIKTAND